MSQRRKPHALWSDKFGVPVIVCPVDRWGQDVGRRVAQLIRALDPLPAALEQAEARSARGLLRKAVDDTRREREQASPDGHGWCPKCGKTKPHELFRTDGKRCTACHNEYERERKRKIAEQKRRAAETERVDPQARRAA